MRNHRTRALFSLCMALLVLALAGRVMARPQAAKRLSQASVALEGLPALTAPGGSIPVHWRVEGGETVERAAVFWDTMTHAYDSAYRYRTEIQPYRDSRDFYDYVGMPQGAEAVYLRPYVVVDGEALWGPEKPVSIWRGVQVGSPSTYGDTLGRVWAADLDYVHNWYGLIGGQAWQTAQPIAGTLEDVLYQRQRVGLSGFGCWLSDAALSMEIEVELHLAELLAANPGERVFDIVLEPGTPDEVVVSGVDVYDQVGAFSALVISRTVSVNDQQLDIALVPIVGEPILNAIAVRGLSAVPQRSTNQRIAYPEHDTYVLSTGNYRDAATVRIGGEDRYHGGLRFFELQVPQGAQINHAELWVTSVMTYYQQIDLTIYGEAADQSLDFQQGALLTTRPRTTYAVPWVITEYWRAGQVYTSPELAGIIQEIVGRPGWRERNALTLMLIAGEPALEGLPPREFWAADGSYEERAELFIDYTPRELLPPTPAPTLTHTPIPSATPTPSPTLTASVTPTPSVTPTRTAKPEPAACHLPLILRPPIERQ